VGPFDYDRYLVDQVIRPIANLYRVTPLAAGETPAGPPIAYVRQKKLAIREQIRFFADEAETQELGRKGGRARAERMPPERRVEIVRNAAAKRWGRT